jgi:hypothetical protein
LIDTRVKTFTIELKDIRLNENYFGLDGIMELWGQPLTIGLRIKINNQNIWMDSDGFIWTFDRTLSNFDKAHEDIINGKSETYVELCDQPYSLLLKKKSGNTWDIESSDGLKSHIGHFSEIHGEVNVKDFYNEIVSVYDKFVTQYENEIIKYQPVWEQTCKKYNTKPTFEKEIMLLKNILTRLKSRM